MVALATLVARAPNRHDVGVTDNATPPNIGIEMVWGDITQVEADFVAVGHYKGMMPGGSELALDRAISGPDRPLVLTEHTRRGMLSGDLGDIKLFPWHRAGSPPRVRGRRRHGLSGHVRRERVAWCSRATCRGWRQGSPTS